MQEFFRWIFYSSWKLSSFCLWELWILQNLRSYYLMNFGTLRAPLAISSKLVFTLCYRWVDMGSRIGDFDFVFLLETHSNKCNDCRSVDWTDYETVFQNFAKISLNIKNKNTVVFVYGKLFEQWLKNDEELIEFHNNKKLQTWIILQSSPKKSSRVFEILIVFSWFHWFFYYRC